MGAGQEQVQEAVWRSFRAMLSGAQWPQEALQAAMGVEDLPLGATPYEVIYAKDQMRLLKYTPAEQRYETPIVFVYSMINRYYILDFLPGRSLIAFMLDQGFPVYCIDWGVPGMEESEMTWAEYLGRYLKRSVRRVLRDSGASDVTLYGYCMGGTLALAYASLYPEGLRNVVVQATPVDFSAGGVLADWTQARYFNVDAVVDAYGNVPSELLESAFRCMDPVGIWQKWDTFFQRVDREDFVTTFLAMERWASDNIAFPGEVYRQYIKDCYQTNNFMHGKMEIGGRRVDLGNITAPVLNIIAGRDTIVPPESTTPLAGLVGSEDTTSLEFACGHIGLSTSSKGPRVYWPQVASWIGARSTPA